MFSMSVLHESLCIKSRRNDIQLAFNAVGHNSDMHFSFSGDLPPSLIEDEEATFEASGWPDSRLLHRKMQVH